MKQFCSFLTLLIFSNLLFAESPTARPISEIQLWQMNAQEMSDSERANAKQEQDAIEAETLRVEKLLSKDNLDDEANLMGGQSFYTASVPRLGIPPIAMTDAGLGIVGPKATAFPANVMMAATWNPALMTAGAQALAREVRLNGRNAVLGPCINIQRSPLGGRNFESYSEDPFLAATMTAAFVSGAQSMGVITTAKHYALNNQETDRMDVSVVAGERAIHEIYLPAFAAAVNAGTWAVMSSYNKINGTFASENEFLLNKTLKGDWGFRGYVVSDWGATHSTLASANSGLDLEMPWGYKFAKDVLLKALHSGAILPEVFHNSAQRFLRSMLSMGIYETKNIHEKNKFPELGKNDVIYAASDKAITDSAKEGITLLKNENAILPIDIHTVKSIAIIGPNAFHTPYQGGGSAYVNAREDVGAFAGLAYALKDTTIDLRYARGTAVDWRSKNYPTQMSPQDIRRYGPMMNMLKTSWSPSSMHDLKHKFVDSNLRRIDNKIMWLVGRNTLKIQNVSRSADTTDPTVAPHFNAETTALQDAVDIAKKSDVAIVFAGLNPKEEGEGMDRTSYALPANQERLIREIAAVNPKTIVVLNGGSSIVIPWVSQVPALVEAWYAGELGGNAIADVLLGNVNPSGKTPVSFVTRAEDSSDFGNFPGKNHVVDYKEGIYVGYRYIDKKNIQPLFPFGFGLSYTQFAYQNLRVTEAKPIAAAPPNWNDFIVQFEVQNIGHVDGQEVAQVYVGPAPTGAKDVATEISQDSDLNQNDSPRLELKGFKKMKLAPSDSNLVEVRLSANAFAHFDETTHAWAIKKGDYLIQVGDSSRPDSKTLLRKIITLN